MFYFNHHLTLIDYAWFFLTTFKNCIELFHSNDYKIVIIFNDNGGGIIMLASLLAHAIQPYFRPENKYSAIVTPKHLQICNQDGNQYYSPDLGIAYRNCDDVFSESNLVTDTYEDGDVKVQVKRTRQSDVQYPEHISYLIQTQKMLKKTVNQQKLLYLLMVLA